MFFKTIKTQKPTCLLTHSRMTETRFEGTCSRRNRSYLESMRAQYRRSSISRLGHHCKLKDDTAYYSYLIMCIIQEARSAICVSFTTSVHQAFPVLLCKDYFEERLRDLGQVTLTKDYQNFSGWKVPRQIIKPRPCFGYFSTLI